MQTIVIDGDRSTIFHGMADSLALKRHVRIEIDPKSMSLVFLFFFFLITEIFLMQGYFVYSTLKSAPGIYFALS
jgi:hypothetical protein